MFKKLFTGKSGALSSSETTVLVKAAAGGCQKSFKSIYDIHSGIMYAICNRYTSDQNIADDMFQEGWVKLYINLGNYNGTGNFEGWARRIFVTSCIDTRSQQTKNTYELLGEETAPHERSLTGIDKLSANELMDVIRKLPECQRLIVNLFFVEGYKHREIAEMLNINENTCKYHVQQGKELLKQRIKEFR